MAIELDHLFVCTAPGAPEAERLVQFGLREGASNQHAGQGTTNRRFGLVNAMIELLWVRDRRQAQGLSARRTLLWERWSGQNTATSPFGICLRPSDSEDTEPPFPSWEYRPAYLADPLCMHIGEAAIEEPMWIYANFLRRAHREQRFMDHPSGVREITRLTLITPVPLRSSAARRTIESGILAVRTGEASLLEIEFDGNRRKKRVDFRPHSPFVLQF